MVMEIIREGLIITPTGSLEPSQGSYNVPVKLINDETYPNYTINMYVGYYVNGVIKKRKCETDSEGHYLIPGVAFQHNGILSISFLFETTDKSQGLMTNALSYEIKYAPNVVVEVPADPTWQELVKEWIQELAGAVNVDNTLTKSGMAADAKATGDAISKLSDEKANKTYVDGEIAKAQLEGAGVDASQFVTQDDLINVSDSIGDLEELQVDGKNVVEAINNSLGSGGGLSQSAKDALINCFNHVAWIDGNGASYVATLQTALNASTTAKVASISAVYSGGSVASGSDLSALKENLVVTATYDDGTEVAVTWYTLSGIIAEGENTITVSYRKVTTTFTVTGLASYKITYDLTNVESSSNTLAVISGEHYTTTLNYDDSLYSLQSVVVTMGGVDVTSEVYGEGTILITEVTGDIVITVVASEPILNNVLSLKSNNNLTFYSTSDKTTQLSNVFYGAYGLVTDIPTKDSIAKITITNNTDSTVGQNTKIYAGQTKNYNTDRNVCFYDAKVVHEISSLGILAGNSITFTANVQKGYLLGFTTFANCEIKVENIVTDSSYDTDTYTVFDNTYYKSGTQVTYYRDEGETQLSNKYYGNYVVSNDVISTEKDTEVIAVIKNPSENTIDHLYIGEINHDNVGVAKVNVYNVISLLDSNNVCINAYIEATFTVKANRHIVVSTNGENELEITFKVKN